MKDRGWPMFYAPFPDYITVSRGYFSKEEAERSLSELKKCSPNRFFILFPCTEDEELVWYILQKKGY